jgi:6-pyruvoyltetrahydropterin/6-carboxytetrahydropterin synthase
MPECTKILEWDAGHRVLGHGGHCRFLHGHHYRAEITVRSARMNDLGMVVDFGCIKEQVGAWILTNFDHNLILHPDDPQLPHLLLTEERQPYIMPAGSNPTAENLAYELFRVIVHTPLLPDGLRLVRVRVWETSTAYADCCELADH